MSYFPDMSQYDYPPFRKQSHPKILNIGWLDAKVAYNRGTVDAGLLDKLILLSERPTNRTRGYHHCPYCRSFPVILCRHGRSIHLGDAEIRVPWRDGTVFACPTLICHYILDHGYRPPDEFLAALNDYNPPSVDL